MNENLKESFGALSDDVCKFNPYDSFLGDLGFVSPIREKIVTGTGFFLQSCSKVMEDFRTS